MSATHVQAPAPRLASQRLPEGMVGAFVFRVCCERCGEVRLLATSPTEACSCGRGRLAQPIVIGVCATKRVLPVVELVGLSAWTESHAEFRRARCRKPDLYGRYVTGLGDGASSAPGGAQAVEAAVPAGACVYTRNRARFPAPGWRYL
jgi:hypothetical protein